MIPALVGLMQHQATIGHLRARRELLAAKIQAVQESVPALGIDGDLQLACMAILISTGEMKELNTLLASADREDYERELQRGNEGEAEAPRTPQAGEEVPAPHQGDGEGARIE